MDPRSGTVGEYLERWLRDYCEAAVTARTLHRYRQIVNMHLVPTLGARKLADLSPLDIEEAKRYWLTEGSKRTKGRGLHPRTVHHHLAVLHDALAQAVRWRLLVVNPCDAVAPVRVPKRTPTALDTDQAARLVELLSGHEYEYIFRLALSTGMRPGEYVALRWDDVDFRARRVVVQQGIWQVTRRDVRVIGVKSHRSERPISLVDDEVALLRQQRRAQAAVRLAAAEWEDTGLVFTDAQGRPIDQYRLPDVGVQYLCGATAPCGLPGSAGARLARCHDWPRDHEPRRPDRSAGWLGVLLGRFHGRRSCTADSRAATQPVVGAAWHT